MPSRALGALGVPNGLSPMPYGPQRLWAGARRPNRRIAVAAALHSGSDTRDESHRSPVFNPSCTSVCACRGRALKPTWTKSTMVEASARTGASTGAPLTGARTCVRSRHASTRTHPCTCAPLRVARAVRRACMPPYRHGATFTEGGDQAHRTAQTAPPDVPTVLVLFRPALLLALSCSLAHLPRLRRAQSRCRCGKGESSPGAD
jgi:hypothetical protein